MKALLALLISTCSFSAFAGPDTCLKTLENKYKYDLVTAVSVAAAREMVSEALPDDGDDALNLMKFYLNDKETAFYGLNWTAPGNAGVSLIAADKNSCQVLAELLIWSEE